MRKLTFLLITLMLAGCSSDDDNTTINEPPLPAINQLPTVSIDANFNGDEKSEITVSADAIDTDGSIMSYVWEVTSGATIDLTEASGSEVSFTLPEVLVDSELVLSVLVTDNDGAVATASTTIGINQLTVELRIDGLVTDSPIANANVFLHISGLDQPIEVAADANGEYSLEAVLDDSLNDAFVWLQAKGIGDQDNAALISLLSTFSVLSEMAGEDKVLSSENNFAVNVTNFTTAQYALILKNGDGVLPTTDVDLQQATSDLDTTELLTLATAIKVAIDKSATNTELTLPEGVLDTLTLVESSENLQNYLQQIRDSDEFAEAQQEFLNDETLINSASEFDVPELYYLLPINQDVIGSIVTFENDGSGLVDGADFSWEVIDNILYSEINEPEQFTYVDRVEMGGQAVFVDVVQTNIAYRTKRMAKAGEIDLVMLETDSSLHYPNGELPDEIITSDLILKAARETATIAVEVGEAQKMYVSIVSDPDSPLNDTWGEELTLNRDGTGYAAVFDFSFDWQATEGDLLLTNFNGDAESDKQINLKQIEGSDGVFNYYASEYSEDGGLTLNAELSSVGRGLIVDADARWSEEMVPGIYVYYDGAFNNPREAFWFEFETDGTVQLRQYLTNVFNDDLSQDYLTVSQYGTWIVNDQGVLTSAWYFDNQSGEPSANCQTEMSANCIIGFSINMHYIAHQDNQYAILYRTSSPFNEYKFSQTMRLTKSAQAPVSIASKTDPVILTSNNRLDADNIQKRWYKTFTRMNKSQLIDY